MSVSGWLAGTSCEVKDVGSFQIPCQRIACTGALFPREVQMLSTAAIWPEVAPTSERINNPVSLQFTDAA
jgi:hypothetical protein